MYFERVKSVGGVYRIEYSSLSEYEHIAKALGVMPDNKVSISWVYIFMFLWFSGCHHWSLVLMCDGDGV